MMHQSCIKKTIFNCYIQKTILKALKRRQCLNIHQEDNMLSLNNKDDILELRKEDDILYLLVQIPWDECPSSWGWVDINVMTLLNADFATGI